jgi:hypothetical protein
MDSTRLPTENEVRALVYRFLASFRAATPPAHDTAAFTRDVQALETVILHDRLRPVYVRQVQAAFGTNIPNPQLLDEQTELPNVLNGGLRTLSPDRIVHLAVDIVALLGLRDQIFEYIRPEEEGQPGAAHNRTLPDYWYENAVRPYEADALTRSPARLAEIPRMHRPPVVPPKDPVPHAVASETSFIMAVKSGNSRATPSGPEATWEVKHALLPEARLLASADAEEARRTLAKELLVTFQWYGGDAPALVARFAHRTILPGKPQTDCRARLLFPEAAPVPGIVDANGRFLRFSFDAGTQKEILLTASLAMIFTCPMFTIEIPAIPVFPIGD